MEAMPVYIYAGSDTLSALLIVKSQSKIKHNNIMIMAISIMGNRKTVERRIILVCTI